MSEEITRRAALRTVFGLVGLTIGVGFGRFFLAPRPSTEVAVGGSLAEPTTTTRVTTPEPPTSTIPVAPRTTVAPTTTDSTTEPIPLIDLGVVSKAGWGAMDVAGPFMTHELERMTLHHTAVLLEDPLLGPDRARQHQKFHIELGWPDLAYHFLVDPTGAIYEGRPVQAVGDTGTAYDPTGHFLECCEGNFDEQDPTVEQLRSVVELFAWAALEFSLDPVTIGAHRDWAETECPGDALYEFILDGSIQTEVEQLSQSHTFLMSFSDDLETLREE